MTLYLYPRYDVVVSKSLGFMWFFVIAQALGGIGLLAILVTALSRRVRRFETWINFCVAWIVSCISYLLLAFFGDQYGANPSDRLCMTQAVLIYGAPVLTAFATLSLVLQLWYAARTLDASKSTLLVLVGFPWVMYALTLVEAFFYGVNSRDSVERLGTSVYCAITTGVPGAISGIIVGSVMITTLVFEGMLCRSLYKHWRVYRRIDESAAASGSQLIRIILFSTFQIVALGTSIAIALQITNVGPNGLIAMMPIVAFLIFGTQKDILQAWMCCRRRRSSLIPHPELKDSDSLISMP